MVGILIPEILIQIARIYNSQFGNYVFSQTPATRREVIPRPQSPDLPQPCSMFYHAGIRRRIAKAFGIRVCVAPRRLRSDFLVLSIIIRLHIYLRNQISRRRVASTCARGEQNPPLGEKKIGIKKKIYFRYAASSH